MSFPPSFLDELRTRLPVSEVVGRKVKLSKRGREFVGLSPFNAEKTPSFTVNDQKGFYHDFSSGKHGDIFSFVMETDGISFPEAVEQLARLANLPLPVASPEAQARENRRKSLAEVVELAAQFFEATLAGRSGSKARDYLLARGISQAMQRAFRLGYAPAERFALKEHLGAKAIAVADMIEAGLLVAGEDIAVPFDRFRDRVIFPIGDWRGRVIGFGGRALEPDAPAKYLNSPETPLFHKGATLYNGASARAAAHQGASIIVVEGYIDVIAMVAAGFAATVAPLGTALTAEQLAAVWKLADEPVLCFDGDQAGLRAAYRAIDLALPHLSPGKSLRFAMLPEGQDPDELLGSGGRAAMEEVIAAALPLSDLLWQRETQTARFDTPERRAALEARIATLAGSIANEAVRRHYRYELEARLAELLAARPARRGGRASGSAMNRQGNNRTAGSWRGGHENFGPRSPRLATSPLIRGLRLALPPREALILLTVLNHPWLLETHAEALAELELRHPDAERLRAAILDIVPRLPRPEPVPLRAALASRNLTPILSRLEAAITHPSDWPARAGAAASDVSSWWTHVITLHRKTLTLNKELKEAEQALGAQLTEENLTWLRDVHERLAALEGSEALIEGFGVSSGRPLRTL